MSKNSYSDICLIVDDSGLDSLKEEKSYRDEEHQLTYDDDYDFADKDEHKIKKTSIKQIRYV